MIPGAISRFTTYYVNKEFDIMCKVCVYACVCAYMCACMHVCVCVCVGDQLQTSWQLMYTDYQPKAS